MAHTPNPICSESAPGVTEIAAVVLPSFTFAPFAGRSPLDKCDTDLVLMTKLFRHDVPAALHVNEPSVAELLKTTVGGDFQGKRGEHLLLETSLTNSLGKPGRYILLIGLGEANAYDSKTSCLVFETLFTQALELGVKSITIPFIPNPMTKGSLTHKATAFKLKHVLVRVLQRWTGPVALEEVKMYCTPAAVRHIQEGLRIEAGEGCPCKKPKAPK